MGKIKFNLNKVLSFLVGGLLQLKQKESVVLLTIKEVIMNKRLILSIFSISILFSGSFGMHRRKPIREDIIARSGVPSHFNVAMLLEMNDRDGKSQEERLAEKKKEMGAVTKTLKNFIFEGKTPIIVSAPIMRALLFLDYRRKVKKDLRDYLAKKLFSDKWTIFLTNDSEFVLLMPGLRKREDLERKGLNPYAFKTMHYPRPWKLGKKIGVGGFYELLKEQESGGSLNMNSLSNMFLRTRTAKKVNKRVYVTGHGSQNTYIANMTGGQYKALRNLLNDVGCSLLYVATCYGGGNVKQQQTWVVESVKRIKSSKRFIEIAEGIPGESVTGVKRSIAEREHIFWC